MSKSYIGLNKGNVQGDIWSEVSFSNRISLRDILAKSNRRTSYDEFNEFASNDAVRGAAHR